MLTLDVYGHLLKEVNTEQAKKLDDILGFVGHSGSFSDSVRSLLEEGNKKAQEINLSP